MKPFLLAGAALALAVPALAADLPARGPAAAPAPIRAVPFAAWTGFYAGLNAGGVSIDAGTPGNISGYTFGLRVGYDHQFANGFVFGVLGDAELSTADQTRTPGGFRPIKIENNAIFSVNLRAGFAVTPSLLLYATGGYSYFDVKITPLVGAPGYADGYNIGAGIEYRAAPNWSVYAEYRYHNVEFDGAGNGDADVNQIKVGVNYRFGSPARPVVARY